MGPAALARLAADTGVQYAVLTTKHHSGFSMFDTRLDDFSVVKTSPYGRGIVREFADAMRAEGIRVGFYDSLCDWHRPDYPAFTPTSPDDVLGTPRSGRRSHPSASPTDVRHT